MVKYTYVWQTVSTPVPMSPHWRRGAYGCSNLLFQGLKANKFFSPKISGKRISVRSLNISNKVAKFSVFRLTQQCSDEPLFQIRTNFKQKATSISPKNPLKTCFARKRAILEHTTPKTRCNWLEFGIWYQERWPSQPNSQTQKTNPKKIT